jgi:uncharacterized protein
MRIDLAEVEAEPVTFEQELELPVDRLDPARVAGPVEVHLTGSVRRDHEGFAIAGEMRYAGDLLCVRCLAPVAWQQTEEYAILLRHRSTEPVDEEVELGDEDLDVVFIDEEVLDLADLAAEQVLLAMPMRVLCDDSCSGLCPTCGANRNLSPGCGCEPQVDPRWKALEGLKGGPGTEN